MVFTTNNFTRTDIQITWKHFYDRYGTVKKKFSEEIHDFTPESSPERYGSDDSDRTSDEQLASGQCWDGFSSTWCTCAPPWHPTHIQCLYLHIQMYMYTEYWNLDIYWMLFIYMYIQSCNMCRYRYIYFVCVVIFTYRCIWIEIYKCIHIYYV